LWVLEAPPGQTDGQDVSRLHQPRALARTWERRRPAAVLIHWLRCLQSRHVAWRSACTFSAACSKMSAANPASVPKWACRYRRRDWPIFAACALLGSFWSLSAAVFFPKSVEHQHTRSTHAGKDETRACALGRSSAARVLPGAPPEYEAAARQ